MKLHQTTILLTTILFVVMSGCASARKSEPMGPAAPGEVGTRPVHGPQEAYGPPVPAPSGTVAVSQPDQVVLVFGPGLARGFACVGILKSLHELKVPIRAIYATEVCALASALYLSQPTLNRMDWALMQFGEDQLVKGSGISLSSTEKKLESKLLEVFGNQTHEDLRIPLRIPLLSLESGHTVIAEKGNLRDTLRSTLSSDNRLSPGVWEGRPHRSASVIESFPVAQAWQQEGGYPVIAFTTGAFPPSVKSAAKDLGVMFVSVPMGGISDADFKKRNQATYQGKNIIQKMKSEILQKIGRTE